MSELMTGKVTIIVLPMYRRLFSAQYQRFIEKSSAFLKNVEFRIQVDHAFEKLWVINSLMNLRDTIRTPNILDGDKGVFAGKPALYRSNSILCPALEINEEQKRGAIVVKDVAGNDVYTNEGFNQMRLAMEQYIAANPAYEVINTTQGGAHIAGAPFVSLTEVLQHRLQEQVVVKDWYKQRVENEYDVESFAQQMTAMREAYRSVLQLFRDLVQVLQQVNEAVRKRQANVLLKYFGKIEKLFGEIRENLFFSVFLLPMNRVVYESVVWQLDEVRFEEDIEKKAFVVAESFGRLVQTCHTDMKLLQPMIF